MEASSQRWASLMRRLGIIEQGAEHDRLCAAYGEPHRHYHTLAHVASCLERLDEAGHLAASPEEVEIALWYHDAVYAPRSGRNEQDSAEWATTFLRRAGVSADRCERVHACIMATAHGAPPGTPDEALVVDVDLSILGCPPARYRVFEEEIRREYASVPLALFRRGRREILQRFLERPSIYHTVYFQEHYEAAARANLAAAIRALA